MTGSAKIAARVRRIDTLSPTLRRVVLDTADGSSRTRAWTAGAHVVLEMQRGAQTWRNAYSLVPSHERTDYTLIVRRVANSRGGSAYIHDHLMPGDALLVSEPTTLFPLVVGARKHLMLAAGIGITPFLSFLPALAALGSDYELHLRCRVEDAWAFGVLLAPWPNVQLHTGNTLDVENLLASQRLGTHLYLCGPERYMATKVESALAAGWPATRLHQEHFVGVEPGSAFRALLARSGLTIDVPSDRGLLDAIEAAGVSAPSLCRAGVCGECRLGLLQGDAEHRDHVLSAHERDEGRFIMPCVSRAKSDVLVLDI